MELVKTGKEFALEDPYLVEGFPGVGLVAKIAADYIVDVLDMELYAEIHSDQAPAVTVFEEGGELRSAIRVYASEEEDLMVLKCDAPVSSSASELLADLNDWMQEEGILPIYQLGIPVKQRPDNSTVRGVFSGDASEVLEVSDIQRPGSFGIIAGPTGGLLEKAIRRDMDAIGLTVESDPKFPDPAAARELIENGVEPITGIDIDTEILQKEADQIRQKKKQLAKQMQEAEDHETSQAFPSEMYV